MKELDKDETVEAVIFGKYGWEGYDEPKPAPIPKDKQKILMTLEEAEPYMQEWEIYGGYGAPNAYAMYVWTNKRVMWITQYDGSTSLDSMPRNPIACNPKMPGG
jgi:hypothetical protein